MENNEITEVSRGIHPAALTELENYHRELEERYKNSPSGELGSNPDTYALTAFNGYYILNAQGAFFAVDVNMYVQTGIEPVYDLTFLVSLDGKTSERFAFTGTFDGTQLIQPRMAMNQLQADLTFVRTDGADGTTATISGTISLPRQTPVNVSGKMYNNPIPSDLYIGDYYETVPIHISPAKQDNTKIKVMSIQNNYTLLYDYGTNDGELKPVPSYAYNINMYFFSFTQSNLSVSLIMGTAAAQGFACSNMILDKNTKQVNTRSLTSIPFPVQEPLAFPNLNSNLLAAFSGYYQIKSVSPLAFVSIQAEYATLSGSIDAWIVMISISLDGVTSKGYYFEESNMKFENNTLTMFLDCAPDEQISITFTRQYDPEKRSLVSITGFISGQQISGNTLFNPVPLMAFSGVTMTNAAGDSLTLVNSNEVIYNGVNMDSIIYVPLMYILAYPAKDPTVVMSFGTNGLQGNTCIITDLRSGTPETSVVYAIPLQQ